MGFLDKLESIVKEVNNAVNSPQTNNVPTQNRETTGNYFSPELEKLISIVLADGNVTDQEKQVLYKKAIALGVDIDELEIVLNARMAESGKAITPQSNKRANSSSASKKCSGCGAPLDPSKLKCPDCGQEYTSAATQELLDKLDEVDVEYRNACKEFEDKKANTKGFWASLSLESPSEIEDVWERKEQIIQTFKIPVTKIDTVEFLSTAMHFVKVEEVPKGFFKNIRGKDEDELRRERYENEYNYLSPVWKTKCEQVIARAKVMAQNDPNFLTEILEMVKPIGIK